jgi:hypothetical protein
VLNERTNGLRLDYVDDMHTAMAADQFGGVFKCALRGL